MVTRFKIENIYIYLFLDIKVSLGHFKVNHAEALSACVVIL